MATKLIDPFDSPDFNLNEWRAKESSGNPEGVTPSLVRSKLIDPFDEPDTEAQDAPPPPSGIEGIDDIVIANELLKRANAPAENTSGLLDQVAQGATFGTSDEIQAALSAAGSFLSGQGSFEENYNMALNRVRDREAEFSEANPKTAIAGNVAGGLVTGGLGAVKALSTPALQNVPKLARLAGVGGAAGAAAGAGTSNPDTELGVVDSLQQRGMDAIPSGVIGAGLGVAIPTVAPAVGRMFGDGIRAVDGVFKGAPTKALRSVGQALKRDNISPVKVLRNKALLGEQAGLLDSAGESIKLLGEDLAQKPGPGLSRITKFLDNRQKGQRTRLISFVKDNISNDADNIASLRETVTRRMKSEAKKLYAEAYTKGISNTSKLDELRDNDLVKSALRKAERLIKTDVELDKIHKNVDVNNPNIVLWDYAKRAIDERIMSSKGQTRVNLIRLKEIIRDDLAEQNAAYGKALNKWRHDASELDALDAGRKIFRDEAKDTGAAIAQLSKMTEGEREMFRAGAGNELIRILKTTSDTAEGLPPNLAAKLLGQPAKREAIEAVLGDKAAFKRFGRSVKADRDFAQTRSKLLSGAQTAKRTAAREDAALDPSAAADVASAASGRISGFIGLMRRAASKGKSNPEFDRELADILTETDPKIIQQTLQSIQSETSLLPKWAKSLVNLPDKGVNKWLRSRKNRDRLAVFVAGSEGSIAGQ